MFERIYIEIGNICNLRCSFCPKLKREPRQMTEAEFADIIKQISPLTKNIYLHVMGEPLLHPSLERFLDIAAENSLKVSITTNGTLIKENLDMLLSKSNCLHKVSFSLHCLEDNGLMPHFEQYMQNVCSFAKLAAQKGIFTVFRLWNLDSSEKLGKNALNGKIDKFLADFFNEPRTNRPFGFRLSKNIFLEYNEIFTWPTQSTAAPRERGFCHGMRDQLAILSNGAVVPCCLDSEGEITLGNVFEQSIEDILSGPRATNLKRGLEKGLLCEPLCQSCTYSLRFSK